MEKSSKNKIKYIVCTVLGIFIILYFVYQVIQMNTTPYKTEVALEKDVENIISTTAFIVRDEEYLTANSTNGTVVSIAEDGKRVGSGETVAVVFQNTESAAAYVRINELEKEIDYYKQLKNRVGVGTNDPSSYNAAIDKACLSFIDSARDGISSDYSENLTELRDAVSTRQLAVGTQFTVDAKLSALEAELVTLSSKAFGYSTVASPTPGYYIGSVDGYEKVFAHSDISKGVTGETISNLISCEKQEVPANIMGKLVDSFDWYLLCNIPYNDIGSIQLGKSVKVNIPNTGVGVIECTVKYTGSKEGETVPVILKCHIMNRDVANLRIEDIEIITDEYKGIKINNDAIREVNGEKGVYTLRGNIVQFKKINIISSTEDYSIIERVEDDNSFVRQYDSIITEGVDLYDGKVIS